MARQARSFGRGDLLRILHDITQYEFQAGTTQHPRVLLEVMSLELASGRSAPTGSGQQTTNPKGPNQTGTESDHSRFTTSASTVSDRPPTLNTLWTELRLRTNVHRPMLAGFLELASPVSFKDDALTISLPAKHKSAAEKLGEDIKQLTATLTEVAGRPTQLVVHLSKKPVVDPTRERISRILGDVDEKEQH